MSDAPAVRPARPEDYGHYVRLFAELGVPEGPHPRDSWEAALMGHTLFIDGGGQPVAYAHYDMLERCGYVRNIAVASTHRRRGLAMRMMQALARLFGDAGCTEWRLNVKVDNGPAIALYERCGMGVAYQATSLFFPVAGVDRMVKPAGAVRVVELPAERDAEAEALFDMPAGLLGSLRGRPSESMLGIMDESQTPARIVGVARFAPRFPGAYPFRLTESAWARPFIEAMIRGLAPSQERLMLSCEDDPALVAALGAAGATVNMELFHMRGDLP